MQNNKECNEFAGALVVAKICWGAVVNVTGEDAAEFLQGQFSQDLREGKSPRISYGFWLSRTGKVEGDGWVVRQDGGGFTLLSRSMPAAKLIERLEHHIIADDVELEDVTAAFSAWWLVGNDASATLGALQNGGDVARGWAVPDAVAFAGGSGYWVGRDEPAWGPEARLVDESAIELIRIRAGVARVPLDLGASDLPQEGGLAGVGVSFNKGCYLGQEVMARVQTTGRVRRRLIVVRGNGPAPTQGEEPLFLGERTVGTLRSRSQADGSSWVGLAMVSETIERGSDASLRLGEARVALSWSDA